MLLLGVLFLAIATIPRIRLLNGVTRTAKYLGSQGCVTFPLGESAVHFRPVVVKNQPPDAATEPWPMGDVLPKGAVTA